MSNNHIGLSFSGKSWSELFLNLCLEVNRAPIVSTRIGRTKELLNPVIVLENPRKRLFFSNRRSFNLAYALVESTMLFSQNSDVRTFASYNKRMSSYSDDGEKINSAYGQYIEPYLGKLVEKLSTDSNTRQACLRIYDSHYGVVDVTKDVPCTLNLHFLIRDGKLNLTVYMRSNDLFWGLQYDLFMFTVLQEVIANSLGLEPGVYIHCPSSLHVYDYHWETLGMIIDDGKVEHCEMPRISAKLDDMREYLSVVLDGADVISEGMCDPTALSEQEQKLIQVYNCPGCFPIEPVVSYALAKVGIKCDDDGAWFKSKRYKTAPITRDGK